jgi:hypothetical protein
MHLLLPLNLNLEPSCGLPLVLLGPELRFNQLRRRRFMGFMLQLEEVAEQDRGKRRR